jgi:glycogen debranching enzyme/short-subunit dehydrogenase
MFVQIRPDIRTAWLGPTMLVLDTHGKADSANPLTGFYFRETRYLRTMALRIHDVMPHLCAIATPSPSEIDVSYVYPEIAQDGAGGSGTAGEEPIDEYGIANRSIQLRVHYQLRVHGIDVSIELSNHGLEPASLSLTLELGSDFADLLDVKGETEAKPRASTRAEFHGGHLELDFEHEALRYATIIDADGATASETGVEWNRVLGAQGRTTLEIRIRARDFQAPLSEADAAHRENTAAYWEAHRTEVRVHARDAIEAIIGAHISDVGSLAGLEGSREEWLAANAGIPLYPALFARDTLTASWQSSMLDRGAFIDASLFRVGALQSHRVFDFTDEEPGRIPYQVRQGPMARLGEHPYGAYYADFASPLMYVIALAQLFGWTGEPKKIEPHLDVARRILDWARDYGDADKDGYLEYQTRSPMGTKNQGWKDSGDSMLDEHGRSVPSPIAACEIQAYWYCAQLFFAILLAKLGYRDEARSYLRSAKDLKTRFNRDFWIEEENYFGLCLDPDKRLVRTISSNVGHVLACGIIDRERLPRVVERMFRPDLWSGWGIRTLSSEHPAYNPISYHKGSIWPVEMATIAFGLRRFGFDERVLQITDAMLDLAALYPDYRIPECVGGDARHSAADPSAYPKANTLQVWNASVMPSLLQSLLGIVPLAPWRNILLVDPILPTRVDSIEVRNLRLGQGSVDLRVHRDERGRVRTEVLARRGSIHVVRQPPPESLRTTKLDRARALIGRPKPEKRGRIEGKSIVITGASSGIGRVTAKMAAAHGARVVVAARDAQALETLASEIRRDGGVCLPIEVDVTNRAEVRALAEEAATQFGKIDVWVNNAAVSMYGHLWDVPLDEARRLMDVNYWGQVHGSLAALEFMRESGGILINVASGEADRALPLQGMYAAAKQAVRAFTDALRMEIEEARIPIAVCMIKPSSIDTPLFEHSWTAYEHLPRPPAPVYAPESVAKAILACCQRPRREVVVGGAAKLLAVAGDVAPSLVDRVMERTLMEHSQVSDVPAIPRGNNLWQPRGDGHERGRTWKGRTLPTSAYTTMMLQGPRIALTAIAAFGLPLALVTASWMLGRRRVSKVERSGSSTKKRAEADRLARLDDRY